METRLSFYVHRESLLHRLNPLTKLTLAGTLIVLAFGSSGQELPLVLFLVVVLLSAAGQVLREFLRVAVRLLLPVCGFIFVMQSLFFPIGETILLQWWIFSLRLEAIQHAALTVSRILVMVSSFNLLVLSTHPSILMSDLTRRRLPGGFAYVITTSLQIIPQMRAKAQTIIDAQLSRGLETKGGLHQRVRGLLPLVRPLVFASLVDVEERAIAIEARAFNTKKEKTSLIEIEDPVYEKVARWLMLFLLLGVIGNNLWRLLR